METRKYSSYAQIDRELEILKIEKEISYQKLVCGIKKTKESLTPQNIVSGVIGSSLNAFSGNYGTLVNLAIPYVIKAVPFVSKVFPKVLKWVSKLKRGN
ncbi:DUF6327 family protein [Flavobacterium sp. LB3P45]|uniref:DUF6327 family protein n=1 Tax=Flavobacterium fructosi TaxID=3230416 RepID=A0ABW6HIT1_9FLAO